jgi:enoyl-CoA hydratase/carnithine racemase
LASEVRLGRDGAVATLTIDNPPVNALHPSVAVLLEARLHELAEDPQTRCVILTGAGRHFMAGADIAHFPTLDRTRSERYALSIQRMQDAIGTLHAPVIAAIAGAALGGGLELAMACDLRIADESASLGQPEVTLGIIPGAGGTQNLPRLVPLGRARRMLFTGERIGAAEALAIGLVDEVAPIGEAPARAQALAQQIARNAPLAVTAVKRAVNLGLQMSALDGHRLEAALFSSLAETEDFAEGARAFFEKRPPNFEGK